MPFDQSTITAFSAARDRNQLLVTWTSTAPDGTTFQVYVNESLAWHGTERRCRVPLPREANSRVSVGTVAAGDVSHADFSASLPSVPSRRRTLTWEGGTYLAADIAGFQLYASATPGGPMDFTNLLGYVPAYPGGIVTDGFGLGGFGRGGFGRSAGTYSWETPDLADGTWTFAVVPVDGAGNADASPSTVPVAIAAAPRPPAAGAGGRRLSYSYSHATGAVTLSWPPSPG